MATPLGPGAEFDVVRRLMQRWGPLAAGIGDDAVVLPTLPEFSVEQLVVSTDTSVEHRHFRRAWLTAEEIGWRATTAALSDLAAMGARARGVLLALTLPNDWLPSLDALADGVGRAVAAADTQIVGGDLSGGDALALSVTVLGGAVKPVLRSGARAGDAIWVTGRLGAPHVALAALLRGEAPSAEHRARFARPEARIGAGQWLASHGASAMIDVSDGLVADLRHVAAASRASLRVDAARVPLAGGVTLDDALAGGEEYELALTAAPTLDARAFEAEFGVPLTAIGTVESSGDVDGGRVILGGTERVDLPAGHDHFSR